jgi:K+/H+ antiporter YhaU regulatory subunit KhtT
MRVEEALVSATSKLAGKTIAESCITDKTGLIILAIKNNETGKYIHNPGQNCALKPGDILIVIGTPEQVGKLRSLTQS